MLDVGEFTLDFFKYFRTGSSICFEPNPELIPLIEKNTLGLPVSFHNQALGEKSKTHDFYLPSNAHALGSFYKYDEITEARYLINEYSKIPIEISTLDSFNLPKSELTMLKVDVQGHEESVLLGAQKTLVRCDAVLLECSFGNVHRDKGPTFSNSAEILAKHHLFPVVFQRYGARVNSYPFERDVLFVKEPLIEKLYDQNI